MEIASAREDSLLAGLIGRGIQLSRTPLMQMAEARAQGLFTVYKKLDMDAFVSPLDEYQENSLARRKQAREDLTWEQLVLDLRQQVTRRTRLNNWPEWTFAWLGNRWRLYIDPRPLR